MGNNLPYSCTGKRDIIVRKDCVKGESICIGSQLSFKMGPPENVVIVTVIVHFIYQVFLAKRQTAKGLSFWSSRQAATRSLVSPHGGNITLSFFDAERQAGKL